ncbi:MAG TPA: argininosuccinate lyase [Solirubrobacterales bacterium]
MSRFRKDPDPRFWRLNRSIEFDWRLAPYDIDQSQAHARALRQVDVIDDEEQAKIEAGLDRVRERIGAHGFQFEDADEDIHMAIERLLGEEIGALAGKLHTGRSRNDQVATDVAMVVQAHSLRAIELAGAVMERLLELAERHRDWAMPGYTHLQRAQPVYLGHHLLAYFWMLARDVLRFQFALDGASVMPLGSGALAGVNWELDRRAVAEDLGFEHVSPNSMDGASNRDFVLDYLSGASICAMHLSRLGSEIVMWSSSEFGFCELDDSFSSGSSIMPQKKNPDSAELLRAKAPRVAADFGALLGTMHALPLTYGKDMQEDKEPLFDAIDTLELSLDAAEGMLAGIEFDRERLARASGDEMLAATEIADLLVRKGVPFREAHGVVGGLVRDAIEREKKLSELTREEIAERSELLGEDFYEVLHSESWLESKRIEGGTSSSAVEVQLEQARAALAAIGDRVAAEGAGDRAKRGR